MSLLGELRWAVRRASGPIRVVSIAGLVLGPAAQSIVAADGELPSLTPPVFLVAIAAAGLLSLDRERGLLGLIFARPVRRWSYVVSRWLGATTLGASLLWMQLCLALAGSRLNNPDVVVAWGDMGQWLGVATLTVAATTAVMCLFSSLVPSIGDACVLLGSAVLVVFAVELAGHFGYRGDAVVVAKQALLIVHPRLVLGSSFSNIAAVASNGSLALLVTILIVNRRDVPARGEA